MNAIRDFCFLIFLTIYRFDPLHNSSGYNEWKGFVGVTVLEIWLIGIVDMWILIWTGYSLVLELPRSVLALACLLVTIWNYMALVHGHRWRTYAARFDSYPPRGRKLRTGIAFLAILSTLSLAFYTLYRMA